MGRARRTGFCALVGAAVLAASACSNHAKLSGINGECFQATDCEPGLVCIPRSDGVRSCDSDLSGVQKTEDASAPRDAPGDAPTDAPKADAAKAADAATQDAATTADAAAD